MKISVDGGALHPKNNQRFGTSIFSENLIDALTKFDKENQYYVYTFKNLRPKIFWMRGRVSIEEFKEKKSVFLALNQALPIYVSDKIINFCHGLSYYFFPQYYSNNDVVRLNIQLREMIKRSDKIIVSSIKVKNELIFIDRTIENKIVSLPFGIPLDMLDKFTFVKTTTNKEKYFLFVGNNQPIKNIDFILHSFNQLKRDNKFKNFKLYLVGNWKKYENKKQGILIFENISRQELKKLYKQSRALLTASHYESFNFPILEALSQGCPVVGLKSAIIPEFKQYVNICTNIEDFVKSMRTLTIKPTARSINRLYNQFNWKNYVNNLVNLY